MGCNAILYDKVSDKASDQRLKRRLIKTFGNDESLDRCESHMLFMHEPFGNQQLRGLFPSSRRYV